MSEGSAVLNFIEKYKTILVHTSTKQYKHLICILGGGGEYNTTSNRKLLE